MNTFGGTNETKKVDPPRGNSHSSYQKRNSTRMPFIKLASVQLWWVLDFTKTMMVENTSLVWLIVENQPYGWSIVENKSYGSEHLSTFTPPVFTHGKKILPFPFRSWPSVGQVLLISLYGRFELEAL